jgi:hypothetical protein
MSYVQYVYHFPCPKASIDVRTITENDLQWCNYMLWLHEKGAVNNPAYPTVLEMYRQHFPERLI